MGREDAPGLRKLHSACSRIWTVPPGAWTSWTPQVSGVKNPARIGPDVACGERFHGTGVAWSDSEIRSGTSSGAQNMRAFLLPITVYTLKLPFGPYRYTSTAR